jgi:two-component system chemotaxis response regulator CheB
MAARNIIAIGASAGGFEALQELVATLPTDLDAAILVTLHIYHTSDGILPYILNRAGTLPATNAVDGEPVETGRIYVAPPDYHLVLDDQHLQLSHGPKESMQRPCINAMFRSVAAAYGPRASGVLLTGTLDDGAAGLWEIQQHGGTTIVQDPAEAVFPAMPKNAIRGLNVQYIVRIREMAPLLVRLTERSERYFPEIPVQSQLEPADQSCPECGGAMRSVRMGRLQEYRCHTGHRFGLMSLIAQKRNVVEHAIESALAQSEELTQLLESVQTEAEVETKQTLGEEIAERREEQETLRELVRGRKARPLEPALSQESS